jgi:hypothetical protein
MEIEPDVNELRTLEDAVRTSDGDGLRARWQFGKCMLQMRDGKRLADGVLAQLATELGVHRSELSARMKFAEKYDEAELSNVIRKYKTWFAIKQHALTVQPRKKARRAASKALNLRTFVDVLKTMEPDDLSDEERAVLEEIATEVKRLSSLKLRKEAA